MKIFWETIESRPYNPDIANAFFRAGEIEAWGRGIERIVEACKGTGTPEPQFKYDGGGLLWTTFFFSKEYQEGIGTAESRPEADQKPTRNRPEKTGRGYY